MKSNERKPEQILDGFLEELGDPAPCADEMQSAGERVLQQLQARAIDAQEMPRPAVAPARAWKLGLASIAAACLLAILLRPASTLPRLEIGEGVRADAEVNRQFSLEDGSQLEMRKHTELSLERAPDGLRIQLVRGSVIVKAAEQHSGHLYVQTRDCTVSVVGTVFLVKVEEAGSAVAVLQGEVHVQHGPKLEKVLPGGQILTNPEMKPIPVVEEVSWSHEAPALLAMLEQAEAQPAGQHASTSSSQAGTIRGVVVREGTNDPIPEVQITVARGSGPGGIRGLGRGPQAGGPGSLRATSDATGRFVIEGVPAGPNVIAARRAGYFGVPVNGVAPDSVTRSLEVAFQQTAEVRLTMVSGSIIAGKVTPDLPVSVEVLTLAYENGGIVLKPAVAQRPTVRGGEYRFEGLPPGEYYVAASVPVIHAINGPLTSELPVRTFYPSATDLASATRIALQPGQDELGLNIDLRTGIVTTISGRVTGELAGSNWSTAELTLSPRPGTTPIDPRSRTGMTNPNKGAFILRSVPSGEYDLYARAVHSVSGEYLAFGRTFVDVRDRAVEGIEIVLRQPIDIKGRVFADGKLVTNKHMPLALYPVEGAERIPGIKSVRTGIRDDGSFTFPAVPEAVYRLQIGRRAQQPGGEVLRRGPTPAEAPGVEFLTNSAYLADVRQGGLSVLDGGVRVGAGYPDSFEIYVKTDGATIQGKVQTGNAQGVPGATVVLIPPFERRSNPALFFAVSSDEQGTYALKGVPPGQYKLFAWAEVPPGAYLSAEFMRQYESRGTSVSVNGGATLSQNLLAIR